ncbi:MAG TPA: hypothetical protein PKD91_12330, partial [Bacteroidia bacterium]|nr:hypothetical protein [Bacteroidia bacterium]
SRLTGNTVTSKPLFNKLEQLSNTAGCSVAHVMIWFPFTLYASAIPDIAILADSVDPEVKIISPGSQFKNADTLLRAVSTASEAYRPGKWVILAGLPKWMLKNGIISSSTAGSTGVVELKSRNIGCLDSIISTKVNP